MCHIYRSSDPYDIIAKLNSITDDDVLTETMIQDIRKIDNVNSIMTLTIADDKIDDDIYSSFSLGNLRVGN